MCLQGTEVDLVEGPNQEVTVTSGTLTITDPDNDL